MQGRVTLEEHHGHTHLTPPIHKNTLARADAGRGDEADTVQHLLEGFLTTSRRFSLCRAEKHLCDLQELLLARLVRERNFAAFLLRAVFQCCFFERGSELQNVFKRWFLLAFYLYKWYIRGRRNLR